MEQILLIVIGILVVIAIILIIVFRSMEDKALPVLQNKVTELPTSLARIEAGIKDDFRKNREENEM